MERKALTLADSGIMPVSGNKEPRVLSRKSSNSLFPYKKRYFVLYPHAPIHPSRNVDVLVKPALAKKLADQEAIGTAKVSVKNDIVPKQGESHSKLELLADSGHIKLSLGPKKLHVSSLVDSNTTVSCLMRGTVIPSLLSPSLNNNDADDDARTNRFNWDLNIPMDLWEASGDDVQDASQIDSKPPSNSASVIGSNGDKGKQVVGANGGAIASSRRRDPLNDPLHSFRHPPAHRLSPMEEKMLPRWISPKKMPCRPDHYFAQGDNTKFTAMQRSGFPRMWSKSPVRSRSWSLLPRTLTEGLNGSQYLSQHRSPVMYREDRMRSSSQTSFTEEAIAPQRRDPPSYTARRLNDMRDVDDVHEYGHPKSLSSRRSPPDQVFTRTKRPRVEILDHQERADGDGYFDGPLHTGRFPELHSGERRKYGESQMRNVKEQEGGNVRPRHEEEFDGSRLKKRRF
ncbi:hypothetical protein H5410_020185 [Solanum commersonii]|uniref:Uncharacterized protein n=1 Tax=Solanum commersonii TaxID=4109 RepID=A0A9J5ZAG9_SOLCO|nr:hypothetical protein H5410_020185 [Solanum commersonii]